MTDTKIEWATKTWNPIVGCAPMIDMPTETNLTESTEEILSNIGNLIVLSTELDKRAKKIRDSKLDILKKEQVFDEITYLVGASFFCWVMARHNCELLARERDAEAIVSDLILKAKEALGDE